MYASFVAANPGIIHHAILAPPPLSPSCWVTFSQRTTQCSDNEMGPVKVAGVLSEGTAVSHHTKGNQKTASAEINLPLFLPGFSTPFCVIPRFPL